MTTCLGTVSSLTTQPVPEETLLQITAAGEDGSESTAVEVTVKAIAPDQNVDEEINLYDLILAARKYPQVPKEILRHYGEKY